MQVCFHFSFNAASVQVQVTSPEYQDWSLSPGLVYPCSTYQYCHCVESISQACSSAKGPDACTCWTADTASSNLLLWKRSIGCSPRLHRTALRPWSCTSCTCTHTHMNTHRERQKVSQHQWSVAGPSTPPQTHTSVGKPLSVSNCAIMNKLFPLNGALGSWVCVCFTLFSGISPWKCSFCTSQTPPPSPTHIHTCVWVLQRFDTWYIYCSLFHLDAISCINPFLVMESCCGCFLGKGW